ncbi:MAG: MBL fold metallo-hydrolase [Hyphomicrobiaceae bacterium]
MSGRLTILGCGASGGVPRVAAMWGQCDPEQPRNRRRRCSVLVERIEPAGTTTVLVDTGPDLREQLLGVRLTALDGVLYTHDHADHTHGIDDLRMVAYTMKRRIPVYLDAATRTVLETRFDYCFKSPDGSSYPPILTAHTILPGVPVTMHGPGGSVAALPILQQHGDIQSLGFRFGNVAYSPDISDFIDGSERHLEGLDVWIVDALRYTPHPSHFHVKRALEWIAKLKPKRAILTHMTSDLDYDRLCRELPPGVEPAYDGQVVEF